MEYIAHFESVIFEAKDLDEAEEKAWLLIEGGNIRVDSIYEND